MKAKFENGYVMKVTHDEKEYTYVVYDPNNKLVDQGHTEYRNIEMYYPLDEIGYIISFCDPLFVKGPYIIENYRKLRILYAMKHEESVIFKNRLTDRVTLFNGFTGAFNGLPYELFRELLADGFIKGEKCICQGDDRFIISDRNIDPCSIDLN